MLKRLTQSLRFLGLLALGAMPVAVMYMGSVGPQQQGLVLYSAAFGLVAAVLAKRWFKLAAFSGALAGGMLSAAVLYGQTPAGALGYSLVCATLVLFSAICLRGLIPKA